MKNVDLNFKHEINGKNLVIAIAQDYKTLEVLMVAYMNKEALQKTFDTGKVHYWSTSRNKIWLKGESSGNFQIVKDIYVDCDEDAILLKVKQIGGACHEGYFSCFFRTMSEKDENGFNLVKKVVKKRVFDPEKVYEEKK